MNIITQLCRLLKICPPIAIPIKCRYMVLGLMAEAHRKNGRCIQVHDLISGPSRSTIFGKAVHFCVAIFLTACDGVPHIKVSGQRLHAKLPRQVRGIMWCEPGMFNFPYVLPLIIRELAQKVK
uniref:Uncharacterized protein n=1 Tax=Peromyscus maniculatus bairdii TaxID=230844 RepID=A0A8C8U8I3_PERMB